jgi:hypothetical protein
MKFGVIAVSLALGFIVFAAGSAQAQDIKPGKWEYTAQMNMGNRPMPQIPPDKLAQMPPEARAKIEQMMHGGGMTYASCITADRPMPNNPRAGDCTVDKMERNGGTVSWSASCKSREGRVSQAEATATYAGDTMTMDMTLSTTGRDGREMTIRQHITGRYLGPCES